MVESSVSPTYDSLMPWWPALAQHPTLHRDITTVRGWILNRARQLLSEQFPQDYPPADGDSALERAILETILSIPIDSAKSIAGISGDRVTQSRAKKFSCIADVVTQAWRELGQRYRKLADFSPGYSIDQIFAALYHVMVYGGWACGGELLDTVQAEARSGRATAYVIAAVTGEEHGEQFVNLPIHDLVLPPPTPALDVVRQMGSGPFGLGALEADPRGDGSGLMALVVVAPPGTPWGEIERAGKAGYQACYPTKGRGGRKPPPGALLGKTGPPTNYGWHMKRFRAWWAWREKEMRTGGRPTLEQFHALAPLGGEEIGGPDLWPTTGPAVKQEFDGPRLAWTPDTKAGRHIFG